MKSHGPSVMILAAGLGTRLRPLTDERPKPLVPVGNRAAIFHVLDQIRGVGPTVINAFHFAAELEAEVAGTGARVSRERTLLGTAGGLARAAPLLDGGDVLVWNADVLVPLDPFPVLAHHVREVADATLVVARREKDAGNVGVDADGRVVRLRRETFAEGEAFGGEFLGIHVIGPKLRATLPEVGCLVGDVYLPRGHAGARIVAFETAISWVDIGTLASYLEANLRFLASRQRAFMIDGEVAETVSVGDGVIVGARARIDGHGAVERVIVWPGAMARAPLSDAIVTKRNVVPIDATMDRAGGPQSAST